MNHHGVVLFHTSSSALRAEKVLKRQGLDTKPIPTPRELSSDCGIALRFAWESATLVRSVLEEEQVEFAGIHPL